MPHPFAPVIPMGIIDPRSVDRAGGIVEDPLAGDLPPGPGRNRALHMAVDEDRIAFRIPFVRSPGDAAGTALR